MNQDHPGCTPVKISDEMIAAYEEGFNAHDCGPGDCCVRAGLGAAAPLVAAPAALAERVKIVGEIRRHADKIRAEAWNSSTGVALGAVVDSVADMVNTIEETS